MSRMYVRWVIPCLLALFLHYLPLEKVWVSSLCSTFLSRKSPALFPSTSWNKTRWRYTFARQKRDIAGRATGAGLITAAKVKKTYLYLDNSRIRYPQTRNFCLHTSQFSGVSRYWLARIMTSSLRHCLDQYYRDTAGSLMTLSHYRRV